MKVPCDTLARLSHLLPEPTDDPMTHFRLDNGLVIATDRQFMAIEEVGGWEGVFYIRNTPELIEQCITEAQYNGVMHFSAVPAIRYTTATTTFGRSFTENIGVWPTEPTDYDKWREIVERCREPLAESHGPMVFATDALHRLALSSPSGEIVLEQHADPIQRPTVVRDIDSAHWVGFFNARINDGRHHSSATVPGWCR